MNQQLAIQIIAEFETLLNEYNIKIPSNDREGSIEEASIYGESYYTLEDSIIEILNKSFKEKKNE